MKLYATVTSERGKPATKGGNDFIRVVLQGGSAQKPIDIGVLLVEVRKGTEAEYATVTFTPWPGSPKHLSVTTIKN